MPDFSLVLRWCRVSRPAVFASAFVKPVFGEPRVVAERLLNFIHWHRVIGVDHFYVYDRYGEIIPAATQLVAEWRQRYGNSSSSQQQQRQWQFYSLADYINSGVVTYIPSPCQLADPNQRECARYADHLATGESGPDARPRARYLDAPARRQQRSSSAHSSAHSTSVCTCCLSLLCSLCADRRVPSTSSRPCSRATEGGAEPALLLSLHAAADHRAAAQAGT